MVLGLCRCEDRNVGDDRDTSLADTLAEVGRRVGEAVTDAVDVDSRRLIRSRRWGTVPRSGR